MKGRVQSHDETDRDTPRDRKRSGSMSEVFVARRKVQLDGMSDTLARTEPCTERWMVSRIPSRSYGQDLEALGQSRV